MKLEYTSQVVKQIAKLPQIEKKKVVKKLEALTLDPHSGKLLKGELQGLYSFRAWPYRIIYTVTRQSIIILSVVHRQSAYD